MVGAPAGCLLLHPRLEGAGRLSVSLHKHSDSITRAAPSQPQRLPEALPPDTATWGLWCPHMTLGGTHIQSAAQGICPLVAEQGGRGPVASAPSGGPQVT